MRALTIAEIGLIAGAGEEKQEDVSQLEDIVVTAQRQGSRALGFLRDLFGFDSGSFNIHDIGVRGGVGYATAQVAGAGVAIPLDEDGTPMIGFEVGVDIDPTDGTVMPSLPNGVGYDPGLEEGWNVSPTGVSYWHEIPTPFGGLGYYVGPTGDAYWGFEPGSPLSPFPSYNDLPGQLPGNYQNQQ